MPPFLHLEVEETSAGLSLSHFYSDIQHFCPIRRVASENALTHFENNSYIVICVFCVITLSFFRFDMLTAVMLNRCPASMFHAELCWDRSVKTSIFPKVLVFRLPAGDLIVSTGHCVENTCSFSILHVAKQNGKPVMPTFEFRPPSLHFRRHLWSPQAFL